MVTNTPRRLIGLDPGLRFTGWGVIDMNGSKLTHIANGSVRSDAKLSLAERLLQLEQGLTEVFDTWRPDCAGVENSFVNRDGACFANRNRAVFIDQSDPSTCLRET